MLRNAARFLRSLRGPRPKSVSAAVIVAHPDDEILWSGGKILSHPHWDWHVLALTRLSDPDRVQRFWRAIDHLNATGHITDLDDGPEQNPLPPEEPERAILGGLPGTDFDLVMTHAPNGEYTRHRRHEEVSLAVIDLWRSGGLSTKTMMLFAYEDGNGAYLPRACHNAHIRELLPACLWMQKSKIIADIYGFAPDSWEARTTPREEAFWQFDSPQSLDQWLESEMRSQVSDLRPTHPGVPGSEHSVRHT